MGRRLAKLAILVNAALAVLCIGTGCKQKGVTPSEVSPTPSSSPAFVVIEVDPIDWEVKLELDEAPEFTEDFIAQGEALYSQDCARCHSGLDGSPPLGNPRNDSRSVDFLKDGFKYGSGPKQIYAVAFYGIKETKAPFGDVYTPEELWSVVAAIEKHLPKRLRNSAPLARPNLGN